MSNGVQYYIIDGANRYGPADLNTLNQWAAEGRLRADMMFEEMPTGRRLRATEIPGLNIPGAAQMGQPGMGQPQPGPFAPGPMQQQGGQYGQQWQQPPGSSYYRAPTMMGAPDPQAKSVATTGVILGIVSLFCGCLPAGIAAIVMGINAQNMATNGDPRAMEVATKARGWGIASLVIGIVAGGLWFLVGMAGALGGGVH